MGREYSAEFKVRYDECGTGRQLRSSIYLSYTQEIATLDAMAAGWANNPWVVRRTRLHIHQPVLYPASLQVKTWASGFSRTLAQRQYLFHNAAGEVVAEAQSLWVNLDRATLRPARIPEEVISLWFPAGAASQPDAMPPWSPSPSEAAYRSDALIGYNLIDGQQHVNNARYLDLLDDATWQALGDVKIAPPAAGFLAPRFYDIEYYAAATFGERLALDTWLSNATAESFDSVQEMRRAEQLIARSQSTWVYWDMSGKPQPLPDALLDALKAGM